jgi:lipopolysaccharide export system protein LptA
MSHRFFALPLWIVLLLLLISAVVSGQQTRKDTTSGGFIIIDHFGKLIEDVQGRERVKWISSGLQLRIDSTYIYGDSAVIFNEDRVFAYGNVVIQQGDSLEVFTDTLYYTRDIDVAQLIGEVALRQGSKQLWTKDLTYHLGERYGEYHQGGTLVDKDLQMTSRRGIYYAKSEEIVFKDSVIVLHPKFNLAADSMTYLAAQSKVLFTGPTSIYTKSSRIYCEGGFYDVQTETAEFNKNAQYKGEFKEGTADTIRYLTKEGEVMMRGNVHVTNKDQLIEGSSMRYKESSGEMWIKGSPAVYADSTRRLVSNEIFYNEKTKQLVTIGGGKISEGSTILEYDHLTNNDLTGIGRAEGHVLLRDTVSDYGIRAEFLDRKKATDSFLAFGDTTYFFSIIDGDTLFISADTLEMWNQIDTMLHDTIRMMRAFHDVRLFKSDMQGRTDSLIFHGRDSTFHFFGNPVLWSDTTQFTADSISMTLQNKKIHEIILTQQAMILSELLKIYYDQIKGKKIIAQFDSSEVKDMWVMGNAESIYYTKDEREAFIGVNKTICSKMYFTFLDSQIDQLRYYGENSSSMLPMFEADHPNLRLEGFRWRPDERPIRFEDILR